MKQYTQNNFLAYLIILLSFFVILFFTKNIYGEIQIATDLQEKSTQELAEKQAELSRLNELKTSLNNEESELLEDIAGFTGEYSDSDMIEYIYSYAQQVNLGTDRIILRGVSLSPGETSDLGFNKAEITISAVVSSEKTLFAFLNYLTNKKSAYRFYITQFSYPMNESNSNMQVSIPLTLYYK